MNKHKHMHKKNSEPHFSLRYCLLLIIAFALCFAGGYILSELIWSIIGHPVEIFAQVVSGLLGLCIFVTAMSLIGLIVRSYSKRHPDNKLWSDHVDHSGILKTTVDAMSQIAQGNFNVLIPIDEYDPYNEIALSVNKMAHELASMEQFRQDFISNVSHEIQSPLTSISGFAALLKNGDLTKELRTHYINIIETESRRLSKLSESLLKLSALEAQAAPVVAHEYRLDKQIENGVLLLEPQWSAKNLLLEVDIQKITFCGDEDLLSQVWVNLLHNAIKFTPVDGSIKIALSMENESAIVTVSDNGVGIAPEDRMHIFERFYKVDKARDRSLGGNGLGLSLVKKIVELHSGQVRVESELGKGTVFTIILPQK